MPTVPTIFFNLDVMVEQDGQVRLLEGGCGIGGVGYEGWNRLHPETPMEFKIVEQAAVWHKKILVIGADNILSDFEERFSTNPTINGASVQVLRAKKVTDIPELLTKHAIPDDTVIVCVPFLFPFFGKAVHLQEYLQRRGYHHAVLNGRNELLYSIMISKAATLNLFQQFMPAVTAGTTLINFPLSAKSLENLPTSEWVVVKPNLATRAQGVIIIPRAALTETLQFLNATGASKMPSFFSSEVGKNMRIQLAELLQELSLDPGAMVIVQPWFTPQPVESAGKVYNPTIRVVIAAHWDAATNTYDVKCLGAYNKFPMQPLSNRQVPIWAERVSHSNINQTLNQKELAAGGFSNTGKTLIIEQSFERKVASSDLIPMQEQAIQKFVSGIAGSRLIHFLIHTSTADYLQQLVDPSPVRQFWRRAASEGFWVKMTPVLCVAFKQLQIDITFILFRYCELQIRGYGKEDIRLNGIKKLNIDDIALSDRQLFVEYLKTLNSSLAYMSPELLMLFVFYFERGSLNIRENLSVLKFMHRIYLENVLLTKAFTSILKDETPPAATKFDLGNNLAKSYFSNGDYVSAHIIYSACLPYATSLGDKAACYYNMASCQIRLTHYAEALKYLQTCKTLRIEAKFSDQDIARLDEKIANTNRLLADSRKDQAPAQQPDAPGPC